MEQNHEPHVGGPRGWIPYHPAALLRKQNLYPAANPPSTTAKQGWLDSTLAEGVADAYPHSSVCICGSFFMAFALSCEKGLSHSLIDA